MGPFRDLVTRETRPLRQRDRYAFQKLAILAVLLAIFDEIAFQRDLSPRIAAPQHDPRPERDQQGRHFPDGRTIGDIAADGAGIADLPAADPFDVIDQSGHGLFDEGREFRIGDARTDTDVLAADINPFHQMADEDGGRDGAQEFRHPEPDIGRPGNDRGLGMVQKRLRQRVHIRRQDRAATVARGIRTRRDRRQLRSHRLAFQCQRIHRLPARLCCGARRFHDGLIAGAAAEIALQSGLDLQHRGVGPFHPQPIQRHDETRRAEAALAAVMIDHGLLDRVQLALPGQMFDGHDMTTVTGGEEADAGIHRLIAQDAPMQPPGQHRAGPAVTLGAAFLGAGQVARQAQEIQQRVVGRNLGQADFGIVQKKADRAGHGSLWLNLTSILQLCCKSKVPSAQRVKPRRGLPADYAAPDAPVPPSGLPSPPARVPVR